MACFRNSQKGTALPGNRAGLLQLNLQLIFIANLIQPRIIWEESLNEGLSGSGWPVRMLGVGVGGRGTIIFIKLIDLGRPSLPWAAPFPSLGILNCLRVEK